jgi:ABC-type lipoprotein export system ATPase subunit
VAYVPQVLSLLDELTTRENVEMPARLAAAEREAERETGRAGEEGGNEDDPGAGWDTGELLAALEIDHVADRHPSLTSAGEQQRTAIGRALRLCPRLLLADEPTGCQDAERGELVLRILRDHAYAGNTVLISSRDQRVIADADRVLRLHAGRLEC